MRILFALMLTIGLAQAQDVAAVTSTAQIKQLVAVVEPVEGFRVSKNVIFVLDVSCSMGVRVQEAIQVATSIASQPVDEMQMAVFAFRGRCAFGNRSWARWSGIEERGVPRGWAALPSMIAVPAAEGWLTSLGYSGGTDPSEALREALSQPQRDLVVFLITDGEFDKDIAMQALAEAQASRKQTGLGPATVIAYGAGKAKRNTDTLVAIGKAGRGGYWLFDTVEVPVSAHR